MLGPFATASRRTPIHQVSRASMSTTTTTTRDRGDRYGPIEWAQLHDRRIPKVRVGVGVAVPWNLSLCNSAPAGTD